MSVAPLSIEIEEVVYARHAAAPLRARMFKPHGNGPFPAVVQVHGGVWCELDRQKDSAFNIALAQAGIVVAAIDFRMPPEAAYPASLADINLAMRWLKSRASEYGSEPERVGITGTSSGGHQAMLAAMRPHDPRYAPVELQDGQPGVTADVGYVALCYPAIDPLERFRHARRMDAEGGQWGKKYASRVLPRHDLYWKTEAAMAEGNPVLALERQEAVAMPPVICVQSTGDMAHPRASLDRFAALYRRAGGDIQVHIVDHAESDFLPIDPGSSASRTALQKIAAFIHERSSHPQHQH